MNEANARGTVKAVCISEKKGTQKVPVDEAILVEDFGIEGDAHAGKWHRQVSLLGFEKISQERICSLMHVNFVDTPSESLSF